MKIASNLVTLVLLSVFIYFDSVSAVTYQQLYEVHKIDPAGWVEVAKLDDMT
jgi:hypothetical protein